MPRFRQTDEILRLMSKKDRIRNVGIIAHVDHGKTTLTDSLLAGAGLLSREVAGKARVLDYLEEEQKRAITIKVASISLLCKIEERLYLINLIDTPGHVDFAGKVSSAMRAIDGAIVVVDIVEGIKAQTEAVLRQALSDRVRPILFINKIDRLIRELKLDEDGIQKKLEQLIVSFNDLIEIHSEPIFKHKWKVHANDDSVVFGSALDKWGFTRTIALEKKIKFSDIINHYIAGKPQRLENHLPLYNSITKAIISIVPDPAAAQKYRIPRIWKGSLDSEIGKAFLHCSDDGPATIYITSTPTVPGSTTAAFGRLFSGVLRKSDELCIVGKTESSAIIQPALSMGSHLEFVGEIKAGNLVALTDTEAFQVGDTLVDVAHAKEMLPFEQIGTTQPLIVVSFEPKDSKYRPIVQGVIDKLRVEDPTLQIVVDTKTGEYLMRGIGELQLEIGLAFLRKHLGDVEVSVSKPLASYHETMTRRGRVFEISSPDEEVFITVRTEPVQEKSLTKYCLLASAEYGNILVTSTEKKIESGDIRDSVVSGFRWACNAGPLCEQPMQDVRVILLDLIIAGKVHSDGSKFARVMSRGILASFITGEPILLEPYYNYEVTAVPKWMGSCLRILMKRCGKVENTNQEGLLVSIKGHIPVGETFGLTDELRSATSGNAQWQYELGGWRRVPLSIANDVISKIRMQKGLSPEIPKPEKFVGLT